MMFCDDVWSVVISYSDLYTIMNLFLVMKQISKFEIDYNIQFLYFFPAKTEIETTKENFLQIFLKNKKMRPKVIKELVDTQKVMVKNIEECTKFFSNVQEKNFLTDEEFNQIYTSRIDSLIKIHQEINELLNRDENSLKNILDTFKMMVSLNVENTDIFKQIPFLKGIYSRYINNLDMDIILNKHEEFKRNSKKYLEISKNHQQNSIPYLLALFNGRLPRFRLLFNELEKYSNDPIVRENIRFICSKFI